MNIRLSQLQKLLRYWESLTLVDQTSRFLGTRVEATVRTYSVGEGRELSITEKMLRVRDIEERLHGPFEVQGISIQTICTNFKHQLNIFEATSHGQNARISTIRM